MRKNRGPRADSIAYLEVCLLFLEVFPPLPEDLPTAAADASNVEGRFVIEQRQAGRECATERCQVFDKRGG